MGVHYYLGFFFLRLLGLGLCLAGQLDLVLIKLFPAQAVALLLFCRGRLLSSFLGGCLFLLLPPFLQDNPWRQTLCHAPSIMAPL